MKKKVVLFDIDGTILNVDGKVAFDIFVDVIGEVFSVDISENLPSFHGKTDLHILDDIFSQHNIPNGVEKVEQLWNRLYEEFSISLRDDNINLLPGVKKLIDAFDKNDDYLLGLVTGNFKANAYLKLKMKSLDGYFGFGAFGCDHPDRDRLPEIALKRAKSKRLVSEDFDNRNAIIIGDTFRDIQCAKRNGMPSMAVATGKSSLEELSAYEPEFAFKDLSDYENIFNTIDNYFESIK